MALAIDIIDGQGLSNEAHHELLPKKSKVTLRICCSLHGKSCLTSCTLLTSCSASVITVDVLSGFAKLIKQDWPILLQ